MTVDGRVISRVFRKKTKGVDRLKAWRRPNRFKAGNLETRRRIIEGSKCQLNLQSFFVKIPILYFRVSIRLRAKAPIG